MAEPSAWPALPLAEWQDTYRTLHLWTQIVGKIRMSRCAPLNHWWHVSLYVNSRGLTTGPIPHPKGGTFEIQFDFCKHALDISSSEGLLLSRPLRAEAVAEFYQATLASMRAAGIPVEINTKPQELPDPVPFEHDFANHSYDPEYANRFWRILLSTAKVLERFRGKFIGKCSPVHFFWGSFDLACTRFSGRPAPPRKGVISGPAYSHEVSSAGFWPGGGAVNGPAFYAYFVPQPAGIEHAHIRPSAAAWNTALSEFILMYEDMRHAQSPDEMLYEFFESTYAAGATLGRWDRAALEI